MSGLALSPAMFTGRNRAALAALAGGQAMPAGVTIPESLAVFCQSVARELIAGRSVVAVTTDGGRVRMKDACELLEISRPTLIGLLDRGVIPHKRVGAQRKIALRDVLAYRAKQQKAAA